MLYAYGRVGGTRGRGEVPVLGQAGVAEACAYTLEGVSKSHKSKMTTNSSNSATSLLSQYFPLTRALPRGTRLLHNREVGSVYPLEVTLKVQ